VSPVLLRRIVWQKFTDVSEVLAASIIRAITSVNFYQTAQQPENCHLRILNKQGVTVWSEFK
jgi:hypothetical protein